MARLLELLSPSEYGKILQNRLERLKYLVKYKKSRLLTAVPGSLKVIKSHCCIQFAQVIKQKVNYIPEKNHDLAVKLAQKEYDSRVVPLLEKDIENFERIIKLSKENWPDALERQLFNLGVFLLQRTRNQSVQKAKL